MNFSFPPLPISLLPALLQDPGRPEPPPAPLIQRDPNLKSWSVSLIGGKKMQSLGVIEAVNEAAAIERAVVLFSLDDERRKRLTVTLRQQRFPDPGRQGARDRRQGTARRLVRS